MQQLKEIIHINKTFQKSINLRLNYNEEEKIDGYIPTTASVQILKKYMEQMIHGGVRSSILIGPYGKGKSHLLLVLLALLSKKNREFHPLSLERLVNKVKNVDIEAGTLAEQTLAKNYYLPVLVSGTQQDINRTFLLALREALEREGLDGLMPSTYYEEAQKTIFLWKEQYPATYEQFVNCLREREKNIESHLHGLQHYEEPELICFQEIYPLLTAGSVFEPMVQMDLTVLYKSINEAICEQYGYSGIVLIFDEFSKFVEGYPKERFSGAMEILQSLCELANDSKNQELHVILVAHKAMKEYKNKLPKEVINAYTGVEGRLQEIYFTTSLKNSYELIQNVLKKEEKSFSKITKLPEFQQMQSKAYTLPYFKNLFLQEHFEKIVATGCYPLTPVTAYLLLKISEIAVQNERTVFTFLTNEEPYSLVDALEHLDATKSFVTAGQIYDYFCHVFEKEDSTQNIHQEWLKAEYALSVEKGAKEQELIKTLALILMVGKQDEMYAKDEVLSIGCGMDENEFDQVMEGLCARNVILFRKHTRSYAFKNNIGVDVDKEIEKRIQTKFAKINLCKELDNISELEYELPKRYNHKYTMTRYFSYQFMEEKDYLALRDSKYLFEETFSDGKLLAILREEENRVEEVKQQTKRLSNPRVVVLYPQSAISLEPLVKKILAVRSLKNDKEFLEDNKVLERELLMYEEDLLFECNVQIEKEFLPMYGNCMVLHEETCYDQKRFLQKKSDSKFNQFLSEILENYYNHAPKINNELINRRMLTGQIKKARLKLIANILEQQEFQQYGKGKMAEATIFRAVFLRTGVLELVLEDERISYPWDLGVKHVLDRMHAFILETAKGEKKSFAHLYEELQGKNYGVRRGVLPLYLAYALAFTHGEENSKVWNLRTGMPVLYLRDREVELKPEVFDNINEHPEEYYLLLEPVSGERDSYLQELEQAFLEDTREAFVSKNKRLARITDGMYRWYCSLPQCSRNYDLSPYEQQERRAYQAFRKVFSKLERNPREILYDTLPKAFGLVGEYSKLTSAILHMKTEMESYFMALCNKMAKKTRTVFGMNEKEDFLRSLQQYCDAHTAEGEEYVKSRQTQDFLRCVKQLSTHDEQEIVEKISKTVLDLYVEDWKEETFLQYEEALRTIQKELAQLERGSQEGMQRLVFTNRMGQEVVKHLRMEQEEDGVSEYLQNEIESALEEFGDSMETNQKITVMVRMIEKLLEE